MLVPFWKYDIHVSWCDTTGKFAMFVVIKQVFLAKVKSFPNQLVCVPKPN